MRGLDDPLDTRKRGRETVGRSPESSQGRSTGEPEEEAFLNSKEHSGQRFYQQVFSSALVGGVVERSTCLSRNWLSTFSCDAVTVQFRRRCAPERGRTFILIYKEIPGGHSIHFEWVEGTLVHKEGNVCTWGVLGMEENGEENKVPGKFSDKNYLIVRILEPLLSISWHPRREFHPLPEDRIEFPIKKCVKTFDWRTHPHRVGKETEKEEEEVPIN